jgi:hypothetical protein
LIVSPLQRTKIDPLPDVVRLLLMLCLVSVHERLIFPRAFIADETRGIVLLALFHCVCVRKKSLTLATSNNLFPRIRPRRRKLTPLIAPTESNAYASDRLIPKRACNPGQSTNSASSFAGDAATGVIVIRALPPLSFEFFITAHFQAVSKLYFHLC